ncbi:unnamed protein product [Peronospora belbahrii]|uniref:Uncharacterized protein n=1 Tax=Peronospora belbahrii TaxID=622444 RepID=A0AAU9L0W4_9STRA|nr:unnamed protein product [Peronospora belbahrii]
MNGTKYELKRLMENGVTPLKFSKTKSLEFSGGYKKMRRGIGRSVKLPPGFSSIQPVMGGEYSRTNLAITTRLSVAVVFPALYDLLFVSRCRCRRDRIRCASGRRQRCEPNEPSLHTNSITEDSVNSGPSLFEGGLHRQARC